MADNADKGKEPAAAELPDDDTEIKITLNDDEVAELEGLPVRSPALTEKETPAAAAAVPGVSPAPAEVTADASMAELRAQLETERAARVEMAEQNRRLAQEAHEARGTGASATEQLIETKVVAARGLLDSLTEQQISLFNDGKSEDAFKLNAKIAKVASDLSLMEKDQDYFKTQREAQAKQPQGGDRSKMSAVDIACEGKTPATAKFVRAHPELVRADGWFKESTVAAHNKAMEEGHGLDSEGYFNRVLELTRPKAAPAAALAAPAAPADPGAGSVAAPTRPTGAPGNGNGAREFSMSPKMRRLARNANMTERDWYINYQRGLKTGEITPIEG